MSLPQSVRGESPLKQLTPKLKYWFINTQVYVYILLKLQSTFLRIAIYFSHETFFKLTQEAYTIINNPLRLNAFQNINFMGNARLNKPIHSNFFIICLQYYISVK